MNIKETHDQFLEADEELAKITIELLELQAKRDKVLYRKLNLLDALNEAKKANNPELLEIIAETKRERIEKIIINYEVFYSDFSRIEKELTHYGYSLSEAKAVYQDMADRGDFDSW